MKTLKITLAALMLSASAVPALAEAPATSETAALGPNVIKAEVNGMVCDFCARAVEKVFSKEDGVTDVTVNLDNGTITITLEEGASISDERVAELVKKSGYDLVAIKRGEA
jgi:copper chaperone CopZ